MSDIEFASDDELAAELGKRANASNGGCVVAWVKDAKNENSTQCYINYYGGKHICLGIAHDAAAKIQRSLIGTSEEVDDE